MTPLDLSLGINGLGLVWLLSNGIITLVCFHLSYEIYRWYRGVVKATGFTPLAKLFQVCFIAGGLHHLGLVVLLPIEHTTISMAALDTLVMFVAVVSSIAVFRSRRIIRAAFLHMVSEYHERGSYYS